MNKFLPSKTFLIFLAIIVGGATILFGGGYLLQRKQNFENKNIPIVAEKSSLEDLFDKDTDRDGLKDWEEALWGTDPKKEATFDLPDLAWVKNRQSELEAKNQIRTTDGEENQTEKFSRELYTTLALLKAENVDQTTVYDISAALGAEMFASELPDYLQTVKTGSISQDNYLQNLVSLLENKANLGNELVLLSSVIAGEEDPQRIADLAGEYKDLANKMADLSVSGDLASFHLALVNDTYKVGLALDSLAKVGDDPIMSLIGLSQYQKYSERIEENINNLTI